MNNDKILEIARRFDPDEPDFVMTEDSLIAFAQAIIEERESSDEPVAWVSCDGYLSHYRLGDEYIPLYRHPPPARKLTEEEIFECSQRASRLFLKQQASARGMQLTAQDSFDWHFAKAIERRINGEKNDF